MYIYIYIYSEKEREPSATAMPYAHVCSRVRGACETSSQLCIKGAQGAKGALQDSVESLNCSDDGSVLSAWKASKASKGSVESLDC